MRGLVFVVGSRSVVVVVWMGRPGMGPEKGISWELVGANSQVEDLFGGGWSSRGTATVTMSGWGMRWLRLRLRLR